MLWTIDHTSRASLQDQIAGCIRRGLAEGKLAVGERLPPAQELADALDVDRNTVLAAYRDLRDDGVLDFRRGRGARIADGAETRAAIDHAARELILLARHQGYGRDDLIQIIKELT